MKQILLIIALAMFFVSASALLIEAPSDVNIVGEKSFSVTVSNESGFDKEISIYLYPSSALSSANIPEIIPAESQKSFSVKAVSSEELVGNSFEGTILVVSGNEEAIAKVVLNFQRENNLATEISVVPLSGLALFSGFEGFSLTDWAILALLIIIAAILLIAFIARFVRRVK